MNNNKPDYSDFSYYTYQVGRYIPYDFLDDKKTFVPYKHITGTRLIWNVIEHDINGRKIDVYNVFEHGSFAESLLQIKKKYKTFEEFAEQVRRELQYYFWSKSEWEVIVTTWPPYIDGKELDRLNKEREEHIKEFGQFRFEHVNVETGVKIDVYDQIMLNWEQFITYLWENRKLITKKKLGITW